MTNDEMVDGFTTLLAQTHAAVDALGDPRATRLLNVAHGALEALQDHLSQSGVVRPLDGGPKPPPQP